MLDRPQLQQHIRALEGGDETARRQALQSLLQHDGQAWATAPAEAIDPLLKALTSLTLAQLCLQYKRLYAASARLYADAFAAEPKLADDPRASHRYDAARSAALAAAGKGEDAAGLDDESRVRLRGQALDWLRAHLLYRAAQVEKGTPQDREIALNSLRNWQTNPEFAGVRDAAALAGLPQAERTAVSSPARNAKFTTTRCLTDSSTVTSASPARR
jgi:hypothetical protein